MKKTKTKKELFNDRWIMIFGITVIGGLAPLVFGIRPSQPNFFQWSILSVLITFFSWVISRRFGNYLWLKFPWDKNPLLHISVVLAYIFTTTAAIILLVYSISLIVDGIKPNYWAEHKTFHLIVLLVFIFTVTLHEATFLFYLWKRELTRTAVLEKENIQSKFDALKNHVNPHFLFNSLGTLSSLINTNQEKAIRYVNEFSKIYRYFLDVNNNDLATIGEEIEFINSYIFLQQIRYTDGFSFENSIDPKYYNNFLLPLTLQLLVENALKHNISSIKSPLHIKVFVDENKQAIVVQNNYQPRKLANTTKTGLINLEQRYLNFVGKTISYQQNEYFFTVEIPILSNEL